MLSVGSITLLLFSGISRRQWLIHLGLFLLTLSTSTAVGYYMSGPGSAWYHGFAYSLPLMLIILSHEMGHYAFARHYGVDVSLPYFIPFFIPFKIPQFGTFGAVIKMKSVPADNRALFDVAFWGPAMSFMVSIPFLVIGLYLSHVAPVTFLEGTRGTMTFFGEPLIAQIITPLFHDIPVGHDIFVHPTYFAAWAGFLITAINLFPFGQLDGGHIAWSLLGKKQKQLAMLMLLILVLLSFETVGWLLWIGIAFVMGPAHPDYRRGITRRKVAEGLKIAVPFRFFSPLDRKRRIMGLVSVFIFILSFTPVPIKVIEFGVKPEDVKSMPDNFVKLHHNADQKRL